MTVQPAPWYPVGEVSATDDSRDLWRMAERHLFRIVTFDNALHAPGLPTMGHNGILLRRDAYPLPAQSMHVRRAPLSNGPFPRNA